MAQPVSCRCVPGTAVAVVCATPLRVCVFVVRDSKAQTAPLLLARTIVVKTECVMGPAAGVFVTKRIQAWTAHTPRVPRGAVRTASASTERVGVTPSTVVKIAQSQTVRRTAQAKGGVSSLTHRWSTA